MPHKPRVEVHFIFPPIPVRCFDYQATREGYEPGDPMGFGPTAKEAIQDLLHDEAFHAHG